MNNEMTWDCTGEGQRPLTPALSHLPPPRLRQAGPMGEGGRSDALEERDACGRAEDVGRVPSPVGPACRSLRLWIGGTSEAGAGRRERVRVREPCELLYEPEDDDQ